MLARTHTVAQVGLDARPVEVDAHLGPGLPGLHLLGLSGAAAREAADRVRAALVASGVSVPQQKALIALAPADLPKVGARFDLAIALALCAAIGSVPAAAAEDTVALGELALDGSVRAVSGVLPSVAALPGMGVRRVLVADDNAAEAALVSGCTAVPVADLREAIGVLDGTRPPRRARPLPPLTAGSGSADLSEVRGQAEARRALEIAAAGGHHLLLVGPPGCGKSMLAARLPSLLPPLDDRDALEVAAVRSVAGALPEGAVVDHRPPFMAPHHGASAPALLGGGSGIARPGALSLAHRGVLFLDELFEWSRRVLEALREPLEDGVVRIARAQANVTYPARVLLVCAANPCPCGGGERCGCPDEAVWRYRARLSGPLADRLDLAPAVEPLSAEDLLAIEPGEPSGVVAARVAEARRAACDRWGSQVLNAAAPGRILRASVARAALRALAGAVEAGWLSGRGFDRTLRVARTIADLAGAEVVDTEHVAEAQAHRLQLGRIPGGMLSGTRR